MSLDANFPSADFQRFHNAKVRESFSDSIVGREDLFPVNALRSSTDSTDSRTFLVSDGEIDQGVGREKRTADSLLRRVRISSLFDGELFHLRV